MFRLVACLLAILGLGAAETAAAQPAGNSREAVVLAANWRLVQDEHAGAAALSFDDKGWSRVTLPHSFNGAETADGAYYRGPAWYRARFSGRTARTRVRVP